eukprot:TRINITY_DN1714_c0_g1_i1.p1 TRINITY_DN1714_c0_g1~~TRINITY_DN1714_c0_g1_i1.p1  ORF type:complete len:191 (-),score=17.68 TRINITY_DN1714_c0_g1_i1:142-714(-)
MSRSPPPLLQTRKHLSDFTQPKIRLLLPAYPAQHSLLPQTPRMITFSSLTPQYSVPRGYAKFGILVNDFYPYERWSIGYHASHPSNAKSILQNGLVRAGDKVDGKTVYPLHGGSKGSIYVTNKIKIAAKYSTSFGLMNYEGKRYQFIFMNRTNPEGIEQVKKPEIGESYQNYSTSCTDDLLTYAILVKEV